MISRSTLQAASRLSPRMVGYHLKRLARNKLVPRLPDRYAARIARAADRLPGLRPAAATGEAALAMAQGVAAFYREEYRHEIDDAARGRFTFFGQSVDFGRAADIDWHHRIPAEMDFHLWRMKLGHMGFLCPMLTDGGPAHLEAVAEIFAGYRARARFDQPECFSSYWFPYSVSHRILALLSGYLIARAAGRLPAPLCAEIEDFLRWNVAFVEANIEHELKNNHVERNLAALCFYYSCAQAVPPALARRLDRDVAGIIRACILDDGLLAERSAMYQGLSVMALQVFAAAPFLTPATRRLAETQARKAARAWSFMTHPDGEIALFNDSWFGEVPPAHAIVAPARFDPVALLPQAGYARLEGDGIFALFDAGAIGPRWNPGHGHADFLSIEVDVAGRRFLTDPGTYQYSTGPRRMFERSAQAHNGPGAAGLEPVSYYGCFRVGQLAEARLLAPEAPGTRAVAGELPLPGGGLLRRSLQLLPGALAISDRWQGRFEAPQLRLSLPATWQLVERHPQALVFACDGARAQLSVQAGRIGSIGPGHWACRYLVDSPAQIVTLFPEPSAEAARLEWQIAHQPA
ncbi:heparinase II/III family protein [Xinfangfangia pollutisoli]|uniref:heparinase II/III family protein n=1 Tax=Xinfangfangia pollutisoli TaxID=2865960 RepID=UPI001CD6EA78|nr:heparinase II/III-family protein [Xinfangfangia pollutisoli]